MTGQLQEIPFGGAAQSKVLNDNFTYLENLITQLTTTVEGISSSLNNKVSIDDFNNKVGEQGSLTKGVNTAQTTADKALTKATNAENAVGNKWVGKYVEIVDGQKTSISDYDLKNYLPDDGNYEIYVHGYMNDNGSSTRYCRIYTSSFNKGSGSQLYVTGYADACVNDFILPATKKDKLKMELNGRVDRVAIRLFGYRKLSS